MKAGLAVVARLAGTKAAEGLAAESLEAAEWAAARLEVAGLVEEETVVRVGEVAGSEER